MDCPLALDCPWSQLITVVLVRLLFFLLFLFFLLLLLLFYFRRIQCTFFLCVPIGTILLNSSHAGVPVRVVAPTAAIFPATMVFSTHHTQENPHPQVGVAGGGLGMTSTLGEYIPSLSSKSPFRIVPIPSINRTQPEELPNVRTAALEDGWGLQLPWRNGWGLL